MNPIRRATVWLKAQALRFAGGTLSTWQWGLSASRGLRNFAQLVGDGRGNAIVVAVIRWTQRTFPEAHPMVYERNASGEEEARPEHEMVHLLDRPNDFYSGVHLWSATLADLLVSGNGYWYKRRNDGLRRQPTELWWIPSQLIEPRWPDDGSEFISHYDYTADGRVTEVPVEDIVHFRDGIDPQNIRKGLSPLLSLARELFTDDEAASWSASLLSNMGVPGVIISPAEEAVMTQEDADRIKAEYSNRFATAEGRGQAMVVSAKARVDVLSFSPQQMNLKDIRRLPEERVTAVFGVPAMVLGLGAGLDRSTYSNYEQARHVAYEGFIIPLQRLLAAELQTQLVVDFADTRRFRFGFDNADVRALQEDQNTLYTRLQNAQFLTINEKRAELGLPSFGPPGDVLLLPMNLIPQRPEAMGGGAPPQTPAPLPEGRGVLRALPERKQAPQADMLQNALQRAKGRLDNKYAPEAVKFFAGQRRRVLARVGGQRKAESFPPADSLFPALEDERLRVWLEVLYRDVLDQVSGIVGEGFSADISFTQPELRAYLDTCGELIQEISDTTRQAVRQALQDGIDAGEGVFAIRQRIENLPEFDAARAEMVVRTELGRSMNQASLDSYRQTGLVVGVRLIDGGTPTSCAECTARNGSVLTLSDAQMANQYDPASEGLLLHPNCTMVLVPLIDTAQMAA